VRTRFAISVRVVFCHSLPNIVLLRSRVVFLSSAHSCHSSTCTGQNRSGRLLAQDFDIAGAYDKMLPDADCLRLMCEVLTAVRVGNFVIKVEHTYLLFCVGLWLRLHLLRVPLPAHVPVAVRDPLTTRSSITGKYWTASSLCAAVLPKSSAPYALLWTSSTRSTASLLSHHIPVFFPVVFFSLAYSHRFCNLCCSLPGPRCGRRWWSLRDWTRRSRTTFGAMSR
jgi:hypothetical protein